MLLLLLLSLFNDIRQHGPPLYASSSPIPEIQIWPITLYNGPRLGTFSMLDSSVHSAKFSGLQLSPTGNKEYFQQILVKDP